MMFGIFEPVVSGFRVIVSWVFGVYGFGFRGLWSSGYRLSCFQVSGLSCYGFRGLGLLGFRFIEFRF